MLILFLGCSFVSISTQAVLELPAILHRVGSNDAAATRSYTDVKNMLSLLSIYELKITDHSSAIDVVGSSPHPQRRRRLVSSSSPLNEDDGVVVEGQRQDNKSVVDDMSGGQNDLQDMETPLEDALMVGDRVRQFTDIMILRNFFIAFFPFVCVMFAVWRWDDYAVSAHFGIAAFGFKVLIITVGSYIPWFLIMFPEQEDLCTSGPDMCKRILASARLVLDLVLNTPVIVFAFMVTLGIVAGNSVLVQVLPFTIVPYVINAFLPFWSSWLEYGQCCRWSLMAWGIGNC